MAGALAERDFVSKLERVGFVDLEIVEREPFGVEDAKLYPLFTEDLVALMEATIPADRQGRVATSVVVKARLGAAGRSNEGASIESAASVPGSSATTDARLAHEFDAGDLGCADGLAQAFRRRVESIPLGDRLAVITRDPAAKEDLPSLARMLGHDVLSVEALDDGRLSITVERGK